MRKVAAITLGYNGTFAFDNIDDALYAFKAIGQAIICETHYCSKLGGYQLTASNSTSPVLEIKNLFDSKEEIDEINSKEDERREVEKLKKEKADAAKAARLKEIEKNL